MTSNTTAEDLQVRAATDDDAEAIAAITERVFAAPHPVALPHVLSRDEVVQWRRRLGEQGCLLVATRGDDVVGFGAIDYNTEQPDTCTLGVWVLPEQRRQGIATALGGNLLDFARDNGYQRVRGRLPEGNEPALAFLSGLGALAPLQNPELRFELPL
jgi:RimJ/RimL family protein N-acetyltransferase